LLGHELEKELEKHRENRHCPVDCLYITMNVSVITFFLLGRFNTFVKHSRINIFYFKDYLT